MELLKDLMAIQAWLKLFKNKDLMLEMDDLGMLHNKRIIYQLEKSLRKYPNSTIGVV